MSEDAFPKSPGEIIEILIDLFRYQKRTEIVELLENAEALFEVTDYDRWNGGTYTWALRLHVPTAVYANQESNLSAIESNICNKVQKICVEYENHNIAGVTISPASSGSKLERFRYAPSQHDVERVWKKHDRFRLFLSHVSAHKENLTKLKLHLEDRGIMAFVAHEDIEPSSEWQKEIETALRSMHALAAFITPDFHESKWTDQEVGWALGREIVVLPIRLGVDPYGLAGKYQGMSGSFEYLESLSNSIVETLLLKDQTKREMKKALINSFVESGSYIQSLALYPHLIDIKDFSEEEKGILWDACKNNDQVYGAFKVVSSVYKTIGKPPEPKKEEEVPF